MTRRHIILIISLCVLSADAQEQAYLDRSEPETEQKPVRKDEENPGTEDPRIKQTEFTPQQLGITITADLKNEVWGVVKGGIRHQSEHLLNADFTMTADLAAVAGLSDARFFIHFLGNNGESISGDVGDFQMVSNIEGYRTFKLYQCWFEQSFPSVDLSFLVGVFDLNAEFYVTPSSALFLNGSHGVGIDLGQSGMNGPSVFPNTSLAVRLRYAPEDALSFSAAVFDGRPGAANDCNSFDLTLDGRDGYFLIGETAYEQNGAFKYAAGAWYYTGSFVDLCAVDGLEGYSERKDNAGAYLLMDRSLYTETGEQTGGLNMFLRFGLTNDHVNVVRSHVGGGLIYLGPISGRDEDELGYAFAYAAFGTDFERLNSFYGQSTSTFEMAHEVTYRGVVTPWLALQYNVQYILNPSASNEVSDAVVHGLRVEISL